MITIKRKLEPQSRQGRHPRKTQATSDDATVGRVPRISKLMALAIRFDRLIQEGTVSDQSALAELSHVSQPRMTQIMNLLLLAPEIQEALLWLPRVTSGNDPITEKMLRPIAAEVDWDKQRHMCKKIFASN